MKKDVFQFISGVVVGLCVAVFSSQFEKVSKFKSPAQIVRQQDYFTDLRGNTNIQSDSRLKFNSSSSYSGDTDRQDENRTLADQLYRQVRVLVMVITTPYNLDTRAKAVRDTWVRRANKAVFVSTETNREFPTIGIKVKESRRHLTKKSHLGFRYVYEHYRDEADWFMKADDDTYVIMENLRYFLSEQNSSEPVYFGHLFNNPHYSGHNGYYSGGAGYVLSKEALRRLATHGTDSDLCIQDGEVEDGDIGLCLEKLGVLTANTTDALGRTRFHCLNTKDHFHGYYPEWYKYMDTNGAKWGPKGISDLPISFHYMTPDIIEQMEYYVYRLRAYGVEPDPAPLNANPPHGNWMIGFMNRGTD